jgi:hypothetical protein
LKHFYTLLTAVFLLPAISFSQEKLKSGYLVTLKNDTLRGYFATSNPTNELHHIRYKKSDTDNLQNINLDSIAYLDIDSTATFSRYPIRVSMDQTDENRLSTGRDTSFRLDTALVEIVQKGKYYTLYSYTDNLKTRFYFNEGLNEPLQELAYRIYSSTDVNTLNTITVNETTYRKQLYTIAIKNNIATDKLNTVLQKTEYTRGDMLDISAKINNISKSEIAKKNNSPITTVGIIAIALFVVLATLNKIY